MLFNFQGSDQYRIRQAIAQIIKQQPQEGLSVRSLDMSQGEQSEEFESIIKNPSFFQESRVLILQNISHDARSSERTLEIMQSHDIKHDVSLVAIAISPTNGRPSAASKKLREYLNSQIEPVFFEQLKGRDLNRWIEDFCHERGSRIERGALDSLISRVTENTWLLAMELEKLCSYAAKKEISPEMVAALVPISNERDEFELSNAIYAHDKRAIVSILWQRLSEGNADQLILGTIVAAIRTILIIKSARKNGVATATVSQALSIHPFVIQKASRGAGSYSEEQLIKTYKDLANLDRTAKDGRADIADGLMSIMLQL